MADFKVTDLKSSDWAFKKINELEASIEEKKAYAESEIKRINDWLKADTESELASVDYFKFLLTQYYGELKAENPKAKLTTPHGKVTSRKQQPAITWDEQATIDYLKANDPELVKITEKFNKVDVKKLFSVKQVGDTLKLVDINGEMPDIANVAAQPDSITVKGDK